MKTIDDKIKECERWKKAEEDLKNFDEMIELIKKYPLIPSQDPPPPPPYLPTGLEYLYL